MSLHETLQNIPDDVRDAGVRAVPAVAGASLYAITLTQWVGIFTILYLILQIGLLIPKYIAEIQKWLKTRKTRKDCE